MGNNVGKPLFYIGISIFALFILVNLDLAAGTKVVDRAADNIYTAAKNTNYGGGSAVTKKGHRRHKQNKQTKGKKKII
jgi:hypothetical protein